VRDVSTAPGRTGAYVVYGLLFLRCVRAGWAGVARRAFLHWRDLRDDCRSAGVRLRITAALWSVAATAAFGSVCGRVRRCFAASRCWWSLARAESFWSGAARGEDPLFANAFSSARC
jgi:hypothetical protein